MTNKATNALVIVRVSNYVAISGYRSPDPHFVLEPYKNGVKSTRHNDHEYDLREE